MTKNRRDAGRLYTKLVRLDYEEGEFHWELDSSKGPIHGRANLKVALDVLYRLLEIFSKGARILPMTKGSEPARH